ncbi:MAG: hypothetical protein V7647_3808 [Acidobacteriota bacterium]|jgi:lysophospholipase L1-like esterase
MEGADRPSAAAHRGITWTGRIALAMSSVVLTLALLEGVLRVAGFHFSLTPAVQFGWPDPLTIQSVYADDPDLFWVTRDYHQKLREARRSHPAIIFMGDSCTEFGTYPARTLALLSEDGPPVTGVHLATGGWSSEQGLVQLRRDVLPLKPAVVVIYYGWNDHWMALGPTDPALHLEHRFIGLAEHVRLLQVAFRAQVAWAERSPVRPNRVPPAKYRDNLETMARLSEGAGIHPVFVTAPSNYVAGHEPAYLLQRHIQRLSDVIPFHEQYVQLTREAARESGAVLCDAAAVFAALPGSHDRYFKSDAIHFTPEGDAELASIVSGCIIHGVPR